MATQITLRRDTYANWTSLNPVLAEGEIGLVTNFADNNTRIKIGDGATAWEDLDYFTTSQDLSGFVTDTELATALSSYVTNSDLSTALSGKQDSLVSGTNIKTVNGNSLLGSGDISITVFNPTANTINPTPIVNSTIVNGDTVNAAFGKTQGQIDFLNANIVDPTQFANSPFFEAENGMYYPVLNKDLFSDSTGLSNHANGGVVATTAGVNGSGSIYLPKLIDMTKPWRCAVLVEINDSNVINELHFGDASANYFTGIRFTSIGINGVSGTVAGSTFAGSYGSTGGIPVGTKVWIGMAYDGANYVQGFFIPDNPTRYISDSEGGTSIPATNLAWDNRAYAASYLPTVQNTGRNCFGGTGAQLQYSLCRFRLQTQSTQNRVIGVWWNQGLAGPKDGELSPPTMLRTVVGRDESATVIIPKTLNQQQTDIVLLHHPNANNGGFGMYHGTNGSPSELAKLVNQGYLVCGITGADTPSDLDAATASNWGAPAGQLYRKLLVDWVRDNVPGLRYLFILGQSMGGLNSARYAIQYPNQVRAVAVVSGAMDLSDSYTNRGFSSIINKAFGTWWLVTNAITGLNPTLVVTSTANALVGATSISVSALASQIPNGTTLTLRTGTGQTTVVTTALANAGATSISVVALTVQVNSGATYGGAAYYTQINYGYTQPDEVYYASPYTWRDDYAQATAYVANDIIVTSATGTTVNTYRWVDPKFTPSPLKNIPFKLWHGDADTLIPIAQATAFQSALTGIGGTCDLVTISGGTHLSADCYDGDEIVAFFQAND
jgi:pimeloyl-ACP methyl ester carboxylesterase